MKTITEYQPLIFGKMQSRSAQRGQRRKKTARVFVKSLPGIYILAGLGLIFQTGLTPLNAQFWMVFAPLFLGCELAVWDLSRRWGLNQSEAPELSVSATQGAAMPLPVRQKPVERILLRSLRPRAPRVFSPRPLTNYPLARVS